MLEIKTLKPKPSKLKALIHKNGLSEALVAQCFAISESHLSNMLNHSKINKHDSNEIKRVVSELVRKRRNKNV